MDQVVLKLVGVAEASELEDGSYHICISGVEPVANFDEAVDRMTGGEVGTAVRMQAQDGDTFIILRWPSLEGDAKKLEKWMHNESFMTSLNGVLVEALVELVDRLDWEEGNGEVGTEGPGVAGLEHPPSQGPGNL